MDIKNTPLCKIHLIVIKNITVKIDEVHVLRGVRTSFKITNSLVDSAGRLLH